MGYVRLGYDVKGVGQAPKIGYGRNLGLGRYPSLGMIGRVEYM